MNGSLGRSSAHTGSEAENNVAAPTRAPPKNLRRDTALVGSANLFNIESSSAELTNQGLGSGNVAQCRAHCRVVFTLGCDVGGGTSPGTRHSVTARPPQSPCGQGVALPGR